MIPKFRAWHGELNMMFEVKSLVFTLNLATIASENDLVPSRTCSFDDIILTQSTGLFDKNGKEIFEGDVVEVFDSRYAVFYDNENASFRLKPRDKRWNTDYMSNYAHEASFEIIGDIYRNPELVEVKE